MAKNRLFVPLCTEAFIDFKENGKVYEIRAYCRNFSEKFVYENRAVELRKGYSGESLWGKIGHVIVGNLEQIFSELDYKLVEPRAKSVDDAIKENLGILGEKSKYIAFKVIL